MHPACGARAHSGPSRCTPLHGRGPSPHGRCSPSRGTWHRRMPPQAPRRKSPRASTPGRPTRISPGAGPGAASQWRPGPRGSASRQPSSGTPTRGHATSCRRARSRPPRQTPSGDGTEGGAQPLPDPWNLPLWYSPTGTLAHTAQAVKGAFPQPLLPGVALLRSLQAGAAWVRWREENGRPSPYFPLVQREALLHAEGMGTVDWGAIVPEMACRWITVAAPQPMRSPPARHGLLRAVSSLAPHNALTREVWRAMLSHPREWMTNPGAPCPPGLVLEQLTAPTPGVRHALHRASALTSNRLGRLGLQRRVEAAHPGGVVEQWLAHHNPSTAQGHWYLHQLLFPPRTAPKHRQQNPYHTHPERLGAQSFPQPAPPALPPGQSPEALQQGPPLDTATTVQQRRSNNADGAEPDRTNCGEVAWTAAWRHLARDTTGLRQYSPTDRTALASTVAAVTMGPVAAWPAQLLPHVPCRDTRPRPPAATHKPTAPLTAEHLYAVRAALLADGGESFVHHHIRAQIGGSIQGPQRDAPHPWHATLRERTRVREAGGGEPPPGPQQGGGAGAAGGGLPGHPTRPRREVPVAHPCRGLLDRRPQHCQARGIPAPTPCQLAAGAHPGLLYEGGPLAASSPATDRQRRQQEAGTRVGQSPPLVWSPDQEEHLRAAWQGGAIRATDVPDLPAAPITHARPAVTLAVAQQGQQNPQWVVCMFSPADAHIAVSDPECLPGPEAVVGVADCACMIVKALREGEHHALLLQVRLKDNAKAAKPGVWGQRLSPPT